MIDKILDYLRGHKVLLCILYMLWGLITFMTGCCAFGGAFGNVMATLSLVIGLCLIGYGIWDYTKAVASKSSDRTDNGAE